ncbi:hypothetical protein BOQ60_03055 [Chryseobacterium sp. CH1]|nr:hypothetical protein BOQ60_03055 [Chryseobacterium sp. CH1]
MIISIQSCKNRIKFYSVIEIKNNFDVSLFSEVIISQSIEQVIDKNHTIKIQRKVIFMNNPLLFYIYLLFSLLSDFVKY